MKPDEPPPPSASKRPGKAHLLTVVVEDYFQATALEGSIPKRHWPRMESHVEENTARALDLLRKYEAKATFFVIGSVAERQPELLRRILADGHEIASKGNEHRTIQQHTPQSFRDDVVASKERIESAIGRRVLGYRVPRGHIGLDELWALDILAEEGFLYDSSFYPRLRSLARQPARRFPHTHATSSRLDIVEFPLSTVGANALLLPAAGGNYFRQLPAPLMELSFDWWDKRYLSPFNMYFHVWELDPDLPLIATASFLSRLRQYRNLGQMPEILGSYLARHRFTSIADFSQWIQEPLERPDFRAQETPTSLARRRAPNRSPLSIVIPCYNEERALPFLENTLREVDGRLGENHDITYVLVDDCSTDRTWASLQMRFGSRSDCILVHHETNQGVAGAILTGIRNAPTEIVCSMDADCTYDPAQLEKLLPLLEGDVVMVTASPYHPDGAVVGVPAWRLFLSKNLSRLYGMVLNHRFFTYTSCFRAYRKSAIENISLSDTGFLGVAEMLILLDLSGAKLAECPATLETRLLGASKIKTARTIAGHLKLLASIRGLRGDSSALSERVGRAPPSGAGA